MADGEGEVLVEEVAQELAHAEVGPAAVHQQQPLQEAELRDGVVRRQHRLHALLARDADADVRRCSTQGTVKQLRLLHITTALQITCGRVKGLEWRTALKNL